MILIVFVLLLVLAALRFAGAESLKTMVAHPYGDVVVHALGVALIVTIAIFIDQLIRLFYWDFYLHRRRQRPTPSLVRDMVSVVLVIVGFATGLAIEEGLSFTFTGLITASGATAVVLGIALQAVIQDLFSGLAVQLDRSYTLGDWLTVFTDQMPEPQYGRVSGISWRSTFLSLEDGRTLMVPNHVMTANPVLNHSRPNEPKRQTVVIRIDNRVSSDRVIDLLLGETLKTVMRNGLSRKPDPDVLILKLEDDAASYEVQFWFWPHMISPGNAQSLVLEAIQEVLQQSEIPMAVSQVELTKAPDVAYILGDEEKRNALGSAPLFADVLDAQHLDQLARSCAASELQKGAVLMRQGDPPSNMYVVLEGAVSIAIAGEGSALHEVAVSATGDIVGEMSLMTGANRTATATAITRVRVLELQKSDIEELLKANPGLARRFAETLALRQQQLDDAAHRAHRRESQAGDILDRMMSFFGRAFS